MLPQDPKGIVGPKIPLDDVVTILEPKEELSPQAMLAQQQYAQQQAAVAAAAAAAAMMDPAAAAPMMDPGVEQAGY
jgi:small subunit ribosomal protein S3e